MKLSEFVCNNLVGGFWHTTSLERYKSILAKGLIEVEPDLPEHERYGGMPFVRSLGGVSLFDFPADFDLDTYEIEMPLNSLGEFIPFRCRWGRSVWLQIDTEAVSQNIRSAKAIRALWQEMGSTKRFMAEIEGAHLGDIPTNAISNAFQIGQGDTNWARIERA